MEHLLQFLKTQHILTIASIGDPVWIFNAFYTVNDDVNFFFASNTQTEHSKYLEIDDRVAFSVSWVEDWDPKNKKGIQGLGVCDKISGTKDLKYSLELLKKTKGMGKDYEVYKQFGSKRMYKLKPNFIKYKDDENYSERGFVEFNF